jgi:hypothetical protein
MVPSIISEDLTIRGNVTSKGEIQVDGEIEGDISCSSLLVGDKSKVTGGVAAEDVVVRGHIVGSIRGLRITLQAQSHAVGSAAALPKIEAAKVDSSLATDYWLEARLPSRAAHGCRSQGRHNP